MSNYYYFASDEEYQYALEHGWIKNSLKKVGSLIKTGARQVKLEYAKRNVSKTPVNAGSDLSEATSIKEKRSKHTESAAANEKVRLRQAAQKTATSFRSYRYDKSGWGHYYDMRTQHVVDNPSKENNEKARLQFVARRSVHDYSKADNGLTRHTNANLNNRERNRQRRSQRQASEHSSHRSAIASYRSNHPNSKLSDQQILKNLGYKNTRY